MSKTTGTILALAMMATSLHAAPLPGFALAAETPHFTFYSRDKQKVDAGKAEQYLVEVQQLLGFQVTGRASYYRYANPQEVAAGTGTYAAGVTFPGTGQIHSTKEFHAHEILHLVAGQMGNPGHFFQEGLAVALADGGKFEGKDVDKLARAQATRLRLTALVGAFSGMDPRVSFPLAGSFMSHLVKAHGVEKVAGFFKACGATGRNRDAAFAQAFGQTLDQAGTAWAQAI